MEEGFHSRIIHRLTLGCAQLPKSNRLEGLTWVRRNEHTKCFESKRAYFKIKLSLILKPVWVSEQRLMDGWRWMHVVPDFCLSSSLLRVERERTVKKALELSQQVGQKIGTIAIRQGYQFMGGVFSSLITEGRNLFMNLAVCAFRFLYLLASGRGQGMTGVKKANYAWNSQVSEMREGTGAPGRNLCSGRSSVQTAHKQHRMSGWNRHH